MTRILVKGFILDDFFDTFDLVGDQLSKSLIQKIFSEYEEELKYDPEDYNVGFDCEVLLTLLGEHEKAVELLNNLNIDVSCEAVTRMLRLAHHYSYLKDSAGVEKSFRYFFKRPCDENVKVGAFIAAGRFGNRGGMIRIWKDLVKEKGFQNQKFRDEVIDEPFSWTCLSDLHIREWDEGVKLLYQYDIRENRDIELYGLVTTLHYKLGFVYNSVVDIIQNEGPYEAFYAMISGKAIATGMQSWMTFYRDMVTVDEPKIYQELIMHLEGARRFRSLFSLGEKLLTLSSTNFNADIHFLQNLLLETGGDMYQLYTLLDLFTQSGNDIDYVDLLEMVINLDPDIAEKSQIRRDMSALLGPLPPLKFV
jgi:tetratricopeptide (TPR) repeat protein